MPYRFNIKLFLLLCFITLSLKKYGQHQNIYSNYLLNASSINPAATGKDEALDLNLYSRKQWAGFNGSPLTNYIGVTSMFRRPSLNFGLLFQNEEIGQTKNQNIIGSYAYRIKFKKIKLSFGLQAGFQILNYNLNKLKKVSESDEVVSNNQATQLSFISGFGIYAHHKNYYAGISIPYLYSYNNLKFGNTPIYLSAGYLIKVRNTDLIKPSIMIRKVNATNITNDYNISYYLNSKYGIGFSYRHKNAIILLLEIIYNEQFKIAYAYDHSTTIISKSQNGSHEISLRYLFGKKHKFKNPRALNF